jgi:hypothetical protein
LAFLAGCGYVGPIVPPSPEIPSQVKDLVAVERGGKIEIFFLTPPRTTDSVAIKKFSEIDLRIGPALEPFDYAKWAETAKAYPVNPPPPGDPFDPKPLPITASLPLEGFEGKRVAVAVRTAIKRGDHYSPWSNHVVLDVIPALSTPTDLKVAASADGVVLDWQGSDAAEGYRILRQGPGDKNLLEIGHADKTHFVDTTSQFDVPYTYEVVAVCGGAESLPSELKSITAIDTFAPSVPGGVTALAGPESIEVSWQRSPEADLAGYFVYRSVNGGAFERQGDMVNLPAFSDTKLEHGKTYRYQISSMDKKNNESAKSAAVEVVF